jgi:putative restriction endonuclease
LDLNQQLSNRERFQTQSLATLRRWVSLSGRNGGMMPRKSWSDAVADAIRQLVAETGSLLFTRQALIEAKLDSIVAETGSVGITPHQTLSRELQQLRDAGALRFTDQGTYHWIGFPYEAPIHGSTKGVFVIGSHSDYRDEPSQFYRFPPQWMANAAKVVGNWIIYQEPRRAGPRGYYAVAKVERIVPDPAVKDMFLALIEPGSFLEFGRDVPFQFDGRAVERGLLGPDGRHNNEREVQSIRPISDADFNRILDLGLVEENELLPRVDIDHHAMIQIDGDAEPWDGPIDRATMLVSRKVRNPQFRHRVLNAYGCQCALTGMRLINGRGRPEAEAAHIMSVEAGGPDAVNNGIALSGTVHWMFDRWLISLGDEGEILLSRKINDVEGVENLIYKDRRARFPTSPGLRPHRRFLEWHRQRCEEYGAGLQQLN